MLKTTFNIFLVLVFVQSCWLYGQTQFAQKQEFLPNVDSIRDFDFADFNGDGLLDLALISTQGVYNELSVFQNTGNSFSLVYPLSA